MPHPALPPEPPSIFQTSIVQNLLSEELHLTSSAPDPFRVLSLTAKKSNQVVSSSAAKSATLLGSPVAVGYLNQAEALANPFINSASGEKESQAEFFTLQQQQPPSSPSSPNSQPVFDFKAPPADRPQPRQPETTTPPQTPSTTPSSRKRIVELTSDRQEYDEQRQIVTASGRVLLKFDGAVLNADRLQVNLSNLIAVGDGNITLTSGKQVLRGERFTYNFVQGSGDIRNARGEIFIPSAGTDFSGGLPTDVSGGGVAIATPSDRALANQPPQQVTSPGGVNVTLGSQRSLRNAPLAQGGQVRRLRFEAEQIDFNPQGWQANRVRITNDPFSPPELELRANKLTLTRETPLRERVRATRPRLVFDQGLSLPVPRDQAVIDRRERNPSPGLAQIGYDSGDRGGVYVERTFTPINTEPVQLSLTPQFYIQEAVQGGDNGFFSTDLFGLRAKLDANLGPRTAIVGTGVLTSLDLDNVEDSLRASLRLRQTIGTRFPHTLALEYSYRDRLYNGSLGYQTVQSSVGGIFTSPIIPLGDTGVNLSYQLGAQYINARTDRLELLEPIRENDRASLSRFQGSAALSRGFLLWRGRGLPATRNAGLRYTPAPVVPYIQAFAGLTGTSSFYSNGDNQSLLTATVGLQGQFGHFSRPFLDYTGFNISYSQGIRSGSSPFLFDRAADTSVLSLGLTQQIYGPFRIGIQTALNLDTGEDISTDYVVEYSRRTYGIILRYNPRLEIGSLNLRISDFNWVGGTETFSNTDVRPVLGGVRRIDE